MSDLSKQLEGRSGNTCELCAATDTLEVQVHLEVYEVPDSPKNVKDTTVFACETCRKQLEGETEVDPKHWRALNDSMWSSVPAVQVVAYRMLDQLRAEGWPVDLMDMMYMEDDTKQWAEDGIQRGAKIIHKDVNGNILQKGDSIVLIKDLDVKGANFIAKRGTPVRNITLVHDNAAQIEGRANGIYIVILTEYVKKTPKSE